MVDYIRRAALLKPEKHLKNENTSYSRAAVVLGESVKRRAASAVTNCKGFILGTRQFSQAFMFFNKKDSSNDLASTN